MSLKSFLFLILGFSCHANSLQSANSIAPETITYYLYIADFVNNFIQIPSSALGAGVVSSTYLAGKAAIYNTRNEKAGTCSASFLCMQTTDQEGIFNDISNYLASDDGLIVTWFTPTRLINLALDSVVNSMVTECIVEVTTKVGVSPFYGKTYNLIVSSEGGKIYFKFTRTGTIF